MLISRSHQTRVSTFVHHTSPCIPLPRITPNPLYKRTETHIMKYDHRYSTSPSTNIWGYVSHPWLMNKNQGTNKSFASTQSKRHNKWSIEAAAPIQALEFCFCFSFLTCIRDLYGCPRHQHRTPRPSSFARLRYGSLNLLIFLKICTFRAWNWTYFANAEQRLSCNSVIQFRSRIIREHQPLHCFQFFKWCCCIVAIGGIWHQRLPMCVPFTMQPILWISPSSLLCLNHICKYSHVPTFQPLLFQVEHGSLAECDS